MSTTARPTSRSGKGVLKRVLVGRAVASDRLEHTLLPKILALPVFSSDALSSVAYATEEILRVLLVASAGTVALAMPISIAIAALLIIVVLVVPPDGAGVSERGRRVHREQGQPGDACPG